jgi:phosphomannomutase
MLGAIAEARGARWEQTLTGFKWVWAAALALERELGLKFVFGYEEALGYSVGHLVHDKDGISAAVLVAELLAHCRARGVGLLDRLNELYCRHGLWASVQRSVVLPGSKGLECIRSAMEQLRRAPPTQIGGRPISTLRDFREGAGDRPAWRGAGNLIELELDAGQSARGAATANMTGGRVLVRPSGTEPKLKVYVDLPRAIRSGEDVTAADQDAANDARAVADDLIRHLGLRP